MRRRIEWRVANGFAEVGRVILAAVRRALPADLPVVEGVDGFC
jgi:hypothetical protein